MLKNANKIEEISGVVHEPEEVEAAEAFWDLVIAVEYSRRAVTTRASPAPCNRSFCGVFRG